MECRYTAEHEWVCIDGTRAKIGITQHAQRALGDLVFVELPRVGDSLARGACAGVVESVKAASEIYAPVTGTVVEVNAATIADPALVNSDPQGAGWLFAMTMSDAAEFHGLLDENAYRQLQT